MAYENELVLMYKGPVTTDFSLCFSASEHPNRTSLSAIQLPAARNERSSNEGV